MWIALASVSGALAVALGAFGAHGLERVTDAAGIEVWRTASHYHLLHSVALLGLALFARALPDVRVALPAALFSAGVVLFSGSLYALVLGAPRVLGPVTPIGGVVLIAGWLSLLPLGRRPS